MGIYVKKANTPVFTFGVLTFLATGLFTGTHFGLSFLEISQSGRQNW